MIVAIMDRRSDLGIALQMINSSREQGAKEANDEITRLVGASEKPLTLDELSEEAIRQLENLREWEEEMLSKKNNQREVIERA